MITSRRSTPELEVLAGLYYETVAEFGRLDVLVNMASVYRAVPFDRMTADDFQAALDVDLKAAFLCARAAAPHMRAAGGGRIINVADWLPASGRVRYKGFVPYYVAKSGVIALTEAAWRSAREGHTISVD